MKNHRKIEQGFPKPILHDDELLTVEDVAALLKVKMSWVYDRISPKHGGRLPHIRLGRYVRFERSAVLEFIQRQRKSYFGATRTLS